MHRLLRRLHLYVGLFVLPYALMYAISAFQMAHPGLLPSDNVERQWQTELEASPGDAAALAGELKRSDGVRGALRDVEVGDGSTRFQIVRLGTRYRVEVDPATGRATVDERHAQTLRFLGTMHLQAGWHHHLPSGLLALTLLGVAACMTFLGATGIYLWFKLLPERAAGWKVLALGLLVGVGLQLVVRLG